MKTIAVDIDEVLARHNVALAKFHNSRYGTNHTETDYFTDHWSEVWKVDHAEAERRAIEFHDAGEHGLFDVVPGALEALIELKASYRLIALTIRRKSIVELTHRWLDLHYPGVFDEVRFVHAWEDVNAKTKAEVCRELGADWLIDDSLRHVALMAEAGGQGLLFGNYAWNQVDALPEGVRRIENWQAALEYFADVRD